MLPEQAHPLGQGDPAGVRPHDMTGAALQLLPSALGELLQGPTPAQVLLWSRLPQVPRINLELLRYPSLRANGHGPRQGLYVAIDRPLRYTMRLLERHHVPSGGLVFLDGIGGLAAEAASPTDPSTAASLGVTTPFELAEVLLQLKNRQHSDEGVDFVLVDNLTSLLNFLSVVSVSRVLSALRQLQEGGRRSHLVVVASHHPIIDEMATRSFRPTFAIDGGN